MTRAADSELQFPTVAVKLHATNFLLLILGKQRPQVGDRGPIRSTLVTVDKHLGVRQWLRQGGEDQTVIQADPFSSSPELRHPAPATVLDIGGSHGQFAAEILRVFPTAAIYSFEPIPECFAEISRLAASHSNVYPIQLALSDYEGEQELFVSRFRDSSSLQE